MKNTKVVAAIIIYNGHILATQRGYGDFSSKWEFPGGKVETNENPEEALIREIKEELNADITINEFLTTVEYDYPKFHLIMDCYVCSIVEDKITLLEHKASKWLAKNELDTVDWLAADVKVVEELKEYLCR